MHWWSVLTLTAPSWATDTWTAGGETAASQAGTCQSLGGSEPGAGG